MKIQNYMGHKDWIDRKIKDIKNISTRELILIDKEITKIIFDYRLNDETKTINIINDLVKKELSERNVDKKIDNFLALDSRNKLQLLVNKNKKTYEENISFDTTNSALKIKVSIDDDVFIRLIKYDPFWVDLNKFYNEILDSYQYKKI